MEMNDPRKLDWIDVLLDETDEDMVEYDYETYDDESNDLDLDYTTQSWTDFNFYVNCMKPNQSPH